MIVEIQRANDWVDFDLPEDKILILLNTLQYDKMQNKTINIFMESSEEIDTVLINALKEDYHIKIRINVMRRKE